MVGEAPFCELFPKTLLYGSEMSSDLKTPNTIDHTTSFGHHLFMRPLVVHPSVLLIVGLI